MTPTPQGSTPGPWKAIGQKIWCEPHANRHGLDMPAMVIASTHFRDPAVSDGQIGSPQAEANARLIASAPTMRARIDALETALRRLAVNCERRAAGLDNLTDAACLEIARALLAKDGAP